MPIASSRFSTDLIRLSMTSAVAIVLGGASLASAQHSATVSLPDSIAEPGTQVVWVKKVQQYCEGPAVDLKDGTVYFTEQRDNSVSDWPIWKINPANPSDTGSRWITASNQSNGLFVDAQGRVIAAQKGKIVRYNKNATVDSVLTTSGTNGVTFGQANDFSIGKNGAIFFSDLGNQIFYLDASRKLKATASGSGNVNGVEWIEEENGLYINADGHVNRYDVGADGSLTNRKVFYGAMTGSDGIETDSHGNWYVGSYSEGAVHVCNAKGQALGKITFAMASGPYDSRGGAQGNIDNCHFGGEGNKTLYCTGDGGLYSIRLKIPGRISAAASPTGTVSAKRPFAMPARAQAYRADGRFWWDGLANGAGPREAAPHLPLLSKP
ncbi:MAG: gluconolactonase precursor [Fibrobacteres bacterium]|nr:gluconolactonase precursor [Fibrobacterota bacterium]